MQDHDRVIVGIIIKGHVVEEGLIVYVSFLGET